MSAAVSRRLHRVRGGGWNSASIFSMGPRPGLQGRQRPSRRVDARAALRSLRKPRHAVATTSPSHSTGASNCSPQPSNISPLTAAPRTNGAVRTCLRCPAIGAMPASSRQRHPGRFPSLGNSGCRVAKGRRTTRLQPSSTPHARRAASRSRAQAKAPASRAWRPGTLAPHQHCCAQASAVYTFNEIGRMFF